MNELNVFKHDHVDVVDSRAVAQMVGKNHRDLMRSIHSYLDVMEKSNERNFAPVDFFVESTYKDGKGEVRPCYLLTKKGCDMVANKMTGEKGVLFTAAYVTAFENMRKHIEREKPASGGPKPMTEYQNEKIRVEKAKLLSKMADLYTGSYQQILHSYATKELEGDFILPLPALPQKTLSAKEVGEELGVSANVIGRIANQYGLKNDANGQWFKDKSPYGDKEVSTFRYYPNALDEFREFIREYQNSKR